MSVSDEEAFESAEEGESETTGAKASSGKPTASGEGTKSKSSSNVGSDKAGGKQKGKQQHQRKTKTKAQAKPATDKKEKAAQKRPATEKPKAAPSSGTAGDKAESEKSAKDEVVPKTESSGSGTLSSEAVTTSTEKSPVKSADSSGDKKDSKAAGKETQKDEKTPEKSVGAEKPNRTDSSEKSPGTLGKSAGEVRQSLSSSTGDVKTKDPADQAIPRDSGGAAGDSAEDKTRQELAAGSGGGGWSWGWGSSLLSAATTSLETFSSQVGEGLTTIIDSVESSFGVPDPQELAQANSAVESDPKSEETEAVTVQPQEKEGSEEPQGEKREETKEMPEEEEGKEQVGEGAQAREDEKQSEPGSGWLSGWGVSSISSMGKSLVDKSQNLMNTGFEKAETLAAGGLDILETIGKKTYTTLTDHDPGLRRAREFLHLRGEKPSLSTVLKEAREQAEEEAKHKEELEEARKYNFTALFEDNQGLAHLEALEMLSNQSKRKVQSLLSAMDEETLETLRLQLLDIKDIFQKACDAEEKKEEAEETEHDFSKLVTENLSELHLGTAPDKLNKVQEAVRQWIADFYSHEDHSEISDPKEIQQRAVQSLAEVTSKAVEQFHKAGELVLMQKDEEKSCTHRADSLARLCSVLVTEVDILANKFSQCLNKIGEEKNSMDEVSPMVTGVYLEAGNASGYIQDAFQLLLPVLQHAALQSAL